MRDYQCICKDGVTDRPENNAVLELLCVLINYIDYAHSRRGLLTQQEFQRLVANYRSIDAHGNAKISKIVFDMDVFKCDYNYSSIFYLPLVRLGSQLHELPNQANLCACEEFVRFVNSHASDNIECSEKLLEKLNSAKLEFSTITAY